jgi:DNA repair protein RadC
MINSEPAALKGLPLHITASFTYHNHPSGSPDPSDEDIRITRRLIDAGRILGIEVLDHVIVCEGICPYKSFKEAGLI